jgi:hypothetical protein
MGSLRFEDRQSDLASPREERPQVVTVGLKGPTAVASQEGTNS